MANKTIYFPDNQLWLDSKEAAEIMGTTISKVIHGYLAAYMKDQRQNVEKIKKLRNELREGKRG